MSGNKVAMPTVKAIYSKLIKWVYALQQSAYYTFTEKYKL